MTRKFVIVNNREIDGGQPRDPGPLQAGLRRCGLAPEVVTVSDADTDTAAQAQAAQTVRRLRGEGVTSVLSIATCCAQDFEQVASQNGWHPEWVYDGAGGTYPRVAAEAAGRSGQDTGRLGLAPSSKTLRFQDEPNFRVAAHPHNVTGEYYTVLQLLAAGIQLAGPKLSPATFASGLEATSFPNPGAGAAPSYQAAASFPAHEPWMLHDYAVWWPDVPAGRSDQAAGAANNYLLCFVDNGHRWSLGHWPDLEARIRGGLSGC